MHERAIRQPLGIGSPAEGRSIGRLGELALVAALVVTPWGSQAVSAAVSVSVLLCMLLLVRHPLRIPGAPLFVLALLGVIGACGLALSRPAWSDLSRDVFYLGKIAVFLTIGMLAALDPQNRVRVIRALIWGGAVESAFHVFALVSAPGAFQGSLEAFRLATGRGTLIEPVALIALVLWGSGGVPAGRGLSPSLRWSLLGLIGASTLLYFSRTLLLTVVLGLAAAFLLRARRSAHDRPARRRHGTIAWALAAAAALGILVAFVLPVQGGPVADFVDKAQNSLNELIPRNASSKLEITQGFRSYESFRAVAAYSEGTAGELIHGRGWGYAVDLGIDTASSTADFQRVTAPVLHNGYLFLLVKTGPVGIALYLVLLTMAFRAALRLARRDGPDGVLGEVAAGGALVVAVTTLVISGLFSSTLFDPLTLLLGAALSAGAPARSERVGASRSPRSASDLRPHEGRATRP